MARRRLPPGEEEPPEPRDDPPPPDPTPPPPPEDTEPPPVIVPPFVLPAPPPVAELPDDRLSSAGFAGAWPALLLPVRIETRWMPAPAGLAGLELRVRLFPDVLHVASERAGVDADEATLAAAFLAAGIVDTSAATGDAMQAPAAAAARRRAWDELVRLRGAPRAAQAVLRVRAGVVASTGAAAADTETQTHAHLLPTRFALVLDSGPTVGQRVAWGADIPALLPAGLADPGAEATRWQFDFDAAERAGLALRVPFDTAAAPAVQRIVALGLRDGTPEAQAQALAEHLERQFGSGGGEFLALGTPTNNADDAPSGFDSASRAAAQSAALLLTDEPLPAGSEGARLALACGLPEPTWRPWAGARVQTDADVAAMHTALWPGTLGTWLHRLLAPAVPAPARAFMQQLFIDDVRARGPLPTLRIGRQPYGVLPATSLLRWRGADTAVAAHVLRELRTHFAAQAGKPAQVPTLHAGGDETVLREALALLPSSRRLGVRRLRPSTLRGGPAVMEGVRLWAALAPVFERLGLMAKPALARSFHGPQAFWSSLAPVSAAQADKTQPLAANYLAALGEPLNGGSLRSHEVPGAAPASLLYLLLRAGLLEQALDVVEGVFGTTTVTVNDHRVNPPTTHTERAWSVLFRMPHTRLGDQTVAQAMARVFSASDEVVAGAADAAALLAPIRRQRAGIAHIANAPVATLERLLHETLDVAAYRLDAWVTALAARRLRALRVATPAGLHIGAWGWVSAPPLPVLPAVPGGPARSDGFELAPSLAHARTAAVLRSGFNRHRLNGGDSHSTGAMAVDLASNRVRAALETLRLARAGQGVGELLGRRLERWLVDQGLGAQTPALRTQAPLGSGRIGIDAVALAEQWATQPPGAPLLEAAAQLHEGVDGLADLMFAEGLHHTISGQTERARAALDAIERGETLPADIEVANGARASASSAWRLALVLPSDADADADADAGAPAAWPGSAASVRASAAPLLDAWAASLLGAPKTLHWVVSGRTAKGLARSVKVTPLSAGLAALDVVLLSGRGAVLTALATQVARGSGAQALTQVDSVVPSPALQTALLVARALARLLTSAVPEPADTAAALERISAALQALRAEGDSAGAQRRRAAWSGGEAAVSVLDERLHAAPREPQARVEALTGLRGTGGAVQDLAPLAGISGAAGVAADLAAVLGAPSPSAWLHDLGRLRPALAALAALVLARPAMFANRWSVRLEPDGTRSVLFGAKPTAARGVLLVLDRWAEAQPAALATAALALHVDAPRARAPQSMLLAVSPTPEAPWTLSTLADVVSETIDMLPLRLLPPSAVAGQYLPGLYVADDLDGEALGALAGSAMRFVPG